MNTEARRLASEYAHGCILKQPNYRRRTSVLVSTPKSVSPRRARPGRKPGRCLFASIRFLDADFLCEA